MDTEIEQNLSIDVGEKTPEPCVLKEGGCSLEVKATESIVSVEEKTSDGTLNTNNPNEPIIPIVGSPSLDKTTNQFDGSNGSTNGDDALEELYPAVVVPVNGEESLEIGVETLPAVMEDSGSIEKSAELPQSKLDIEIIAEKMESSSTSVENEIDSNKNDCMNNIITNDEDNSLTVEEETNRKEPDSVAEKEINSDPVSEEINKMEVECIVEEETISKLNESVLEQKTNEKENESVIAQELHNKEIDSVNELEIAEKETSPMLENEKNGTGEVQMMNGELSLDSVIEQEAAEKETSPVLKRERSSAGDVVEMVNGELSSDSVGTSVTPKVIDTGEIPQTSVPNVVAKFVDSSVANVASTSNFIPDNDVTSVLKDVKSAMVNGDITPVESSNKDMENQEINNTQGDTEIIEKRNPLELQESKLDEACVVKDCDKIEENKTNVGSDIPEEKSYTENECEEMDIQMEDVKDENECKIEIDNTCSTSCETKDEKENKVENTVCEGNKTESDVRSKLENLSESQDSIVLLSEGSDVEKDKVTNNQCEETLKNNADIVKTENMKNLDQNLDNDNECVQTEKDTCDSDKNIFNLVTVGAKDSIDMNSTESLSPPVLTEEVQQGNIDIDNDSIDEEPMDIDPVIKEDTKETPVKEPESNNDKKSEKIESECESDKSKTMVRSKTCSQSFKLDQVLSKITSKAENDSLKNKTANAPSVPKKAKARKSCGAQAQSLNKPSVPSLGLSSTITSLTFNVKELEKQGVLDMPKTNKRKAFEPMKVKSNDQGTQASIAVPAKTSPIRSPVKSPNKTENPFFKKSKLMKGKRKKGKRSGVYRLPGEKTHKKYKSRKKESEERQLTESDQDQDSVKLKKLNDNTRNKNKSGTIEYDPNSPQRTKNVSEANVASPTQNALDMLTKNSKLSFQSTPSSGVKKAKKSMRHGIDPTSTHRTLDAFLKGGSYYPFNSSLKKNREALLEKSQGSEDSQESVGSEMRKRKAPEGSSQKSSLNTSADSSFVSPEEKKRKMERTKSPLPQMITLFPTGSPPPTIRPIISSSVPVSGSPILIGTGPTSTQPTLIQNGTINGLPMFQIFNNQTVNTSQPPQLVAIAQSPGKSLLNPLPRNSIPKGMPMLLTAVPIPRFVTNGASMSQPQQIISSQASIVSSLPNSIMGTQLIPVSVSKSSAQLQHPTVLKSIITPPRSHLLNGQHLLDAKSMSKIGSLPNGLYPVTPPKTPEEHQTSEAISQESVEVSPGGAIPPDKDVIPLCTCKINGASFQKVSTTVTYCQALDSVDGKVMGCCNKVTNSQLVRPAVKIPFLAVCEAHRKRLRLHQCCPGCGHFCTQGKFMQCRKDGSNSLHHFHEQCQVVKDSKNYCPHCGETSSQFEVHLTMQESKPSVVKDSKSSRVQVKGRIGVTDRRSAGTVEEQEEPGVTHVIEKTKKILSTSEIPIGPDRYSLERVLGSLAHERPKKYRHLPKCLFTPAYDNDLERTVYMLEDGHDANEKYEDLEGQGALHAAATVGSLAIVHCLVQAGASPHLQDTSLRTPLMYSAENNHADVVSYLVKAGAVIDAKADDGMTALHYAAKAGHVGIISLLLDTDRLNIDVKDDGGWTPLIWAAEHQEMEAVKFLLKRNAEPNLRDSEENTTLHWAAFSGSVAIAELLLTAGCDLDSLNMHGDRPLHIAARQDHYECVVLFLARGADVEAKNNKGETPLECCLEKNTQVYLALKVNKQLKGFGAKHMGRPERLLHRDLSKGRENIPIPCVNAVDDEGIPSDYLYVTDNIETTCLNINRVIGSLQSCQCKDDCSSIYCACGKNSLRCWYDKYGRLVPEINMLEPPLIFECNRACECWTTCNNRVVQNGVMSRLQVFKTQGRGWGCKTLVDIQQGTFICEYIGEHISDSEADRREDDSYLFDLDNKDGETYCIDARRYGNIARFINHLCEPNLVPVKVFVDSQDLRFPRICLFASRDIKANEELGFDYGQKFWIIKWKQFTCTCGSLKCRYSTETIQKTLEEYGQRHDEDDGEVVIQE